MTAAPERKGALAPYAADPTRSRGRRHAEPAAPPRNDFQRDRDRVIHSTAFRRLVYKTQVFLNHEGDLFRTRLTHSLEVAQIGRSVGRALCLHEDLIEAIALAHDLGHTPFGHAGQDALDEALRAAEPDGAGFEHNIQSLRVVDRLEERYPAFDGLNLTFETREGLLKRCGLRYRQWLAVNDPTGLHLRFERGTQPSLEAQLCNIVDAVAYGMHDVDDGVRSGLLAAESLDDIPLMQRFRREASHDHPELTGRRLLFETLRRALTAQIQDLVAATQARIDAAGVSDAAAVRACPPLVGFSGAMRSEVAELHRFLLRRLYRHERVMESTALARRLLADLFERYLHDPSSMPTRLPPHRSPARAVADYIAGMTDRFALREHQRLTGRTVQWPDLSAGTG